MRTIRRMDCKRIRQKAYGQLAFPQHCVQHFVGTSQSQPGVLNNGAIKVSTREEDVVTQVGERMLAININGLLSWRGLTYSFYYIYSHCKRKFHARVIGTY